MFNGSFDPGFTLELHTKDLRIGHDLCKRYGVSTDKSVLELARKNYEEAMERFGEAAGSSHPGKLVEQRDKTSFFVPGWHGWGYTATAPKDDGRGGTGLAVKHSLKAKL
jgi:NAD-binding of NADP-dependent 3-hydroxyisobutyrate dehydrogenase